MTVWDEIGAQEFARAPQQYPELFIHGYVCRGISSDLLRFVGGCGYDLRPCQIMNYNFPMIVL